MNPTSSEMDDLHDSSAALWLGVHGQVGVHGHFFGGLDFPVRGVPRAALFMTLVSSVDLVDRKEDPLLLWHGMWVPFFCWHNGSRISPSMTGRLFGGDSRVR